MGDFSFKQPGDKCVQQPCGGHGRLEAVKGIEVGHVFNLGTKYTEAFGAFFREANQSRPRPLHMGCYGIGLTRLMAAHIESKEGHDKNGIIWPEAMAPFLVYITAVGKPDPSSAHKLPTSFNRPP